MLSTCTRAHTHTRTRARTHTHTHTDIYPPCTVSSSCKSLGTHLHSTGSEKSCREETCFFDYGTFLFSERHLVTCSAEKFENFCFNNNSHFCGIFVGSFKKPQGLGPAPEHFTRVTKGRTRRGMGFFLKLPRCFQGVAEGGNYCFIVSFSELHVIKLCCLYACLIIKVILACCLKKRNQRTQTLPR